MARKKSLNQILEELIEQFIPEIQTAFATAIQGVVDTAIIADIIKAIEEGDVLGAFRAVGYSDAAMRPLTAVVERAFETGGVTVGSTFPKRLNTPSGRTVYRFDVRNSRAEKWLREQSSRLVTQIGEEALIGVRNVMFEGVKVGRNPRNVALDIVGRINPVTRKREGGIIGLTTRQEHWTAKTRRDLEELSENYFSRKLRDKRFDGTVRKAIADNKPLPPETINKLVGRYKSNALRYRGETVARTEAISALNRSAYEAVEQAVDIGAVKRKSVKRVWDSSGRDGRTRDSHLAMDGQTVAMDEPFKTPDGALLMFPGDTSLGAPGEETINCRCRVRLKIDWLDDLD